MKSISRAVRMASAFLAFAVVSAAGAASAPTPVFEFATSNGAAEAKGAPALPAGKVAAASPFAATAAPAMSSSSAFAKLGQPLLDEVEPNGTTATATPLAGNRAVVLGNIFAAGDVDFYSFTANAGDRVYAATMTSFSAGNSTDSQLTVLDTDGITVIEFDDDSGIMAALSSVIAGAVIPSTGTYFIKVNDFTAASGMEKGYELHFRLQSGTPTPEVEPNDTPGTANPLPANGWVSGARNPATATEQDWFSFTLNAGDTAYLSLDLDPEDDLVTWNGRLGVALFGDAANQILPADDAGTSDTGSTPPTTNRPGEALFMTAKTAGTYFAFVDSATAATGGPTATYHLSVTVHPAANEGVNCTTYTSTDVPKTIGPGNALVSSTITVPGNPRIADLDVDIVLNHVLMTEVDAHLRSPAGNDIGLFTDIGSNAIGGQAQMDTVFDDEAGTIPFFTALRGLQYKPEVAYRLNWFDGENAGGTWTLDLRDDVNNANGGTLTSWSLRICEVPPPPACPPGFGPQTVYSTDFESGAAGFTHGGTLDEWELGLPATLATTTANPPPVAAFSTCNSGVNCWKTDLDGTYELGSSQDLLSAPINLAGLTAPVVVNWAMRYQMENATFDHMSVDAQQVGGATPTRLFEWLGPTMTDAPGNPAVNIGASAGWAVHSARADSLAGLNTELRFHVDSDATSVNLGGLAIDDVSVTACRALSADLSITKTDGVTTATPGGSVTYTITASNAGPDPVTGGTVADTFPASLTCNSTCVGAGGGTCTAGPMAGNINDTVNLPVGGSVTYTASCVISASATGSLSNTATVASGIGDPDPANNSATDTDTLTPQANLGITKTDGVTTATPGGSVTYMITASNPGPSNAPGATVADTFPATLTCNTTCVGAGGGTCTAGPFAGNISDTANLPAGGSVTYTSACAISAAATGMLSNTATVATPGGVTDSDPANNSATDSDTLTPQADLAITKTDGVTSAVPGGSTTYTITASNAGPSNAPGSIVADTFPATLSCNTTCTGAGGGTCTAGPFAGNINDTANLPAGGSVTYTSVCAISGTATGSLANTATVTAAGGVSEVNPGNNSATDTDTLDPQADLSITKTDGVDAFVPGGSLTYTIVASNAGPSDVTGATVTDTFPGALSCDWTCVGTSGGTCTAGPMAGNISDTVNLPAGASATYTAVCDVASGATGTIANTATIEAPAGVNDANTGNNSFTDTDSIDPQADLSITKTDGTATATPGGTLTYTIVAANAGPSGITGAAIADTLPADLTCTWTCSGAGGGACTAGAGAGNITDTVDLPVGATVTYSASCAVDGSASAPIVNTATITAPAGATEIDTGNNSATDTDTIAASADLSITKTDGVTSTGAGDTLTYSIVASNAGPSNATGATVTDAFPADLTCTWTCAGSGGASCGAGGSGNIADAANLPAGGSATYTAVCDVSATATGPIVNIATVEAPAGVADPDTGNNSATDSDTVNAAEADLSITKTDGVTSTSAGDTLTYSIVASNAGPSNATGATVTDTFPADLTCTWTCAGSGGATCGAGGSGNIADAANLPSGSSATYIAVCDVSATATGPIVNIATVEAPGDVIDPDTGNNSATDSDTIDANEADLSITKTDGVTSTSAGGTLTYSIVASNAGPNIATGATVTDTFPAALTCTWTCAGSGSATCGAGGAGNIADNVILPPGGSATYTAVCDVSDAATGSIVNTATIAAPADVDDPATGNNSATDTDTVLDTSDLSITKTDGATTVNPGQSLTYVIVASNSGPQTATGASVDDTFPAECSSITWTCSGAGGGTCTANGSGDINDTVNLPASASVTYTAACAIDAATPDGTVVSNTATVALAGGTPDPVPGNDSATDTTTVFGAPDVSGTKTVTGDFAPGDTVTYSIVLNNDGNAAQPDNPGDEFSDTLPAGLTHVSSSATAGTTSFAAGVVRWNGTLAVGASVTITIEATIDEDASGVINNQGTVNYDADNNGSNEASSPTDDPTETGDANPTGFTVDGGTVEPPPASMPAVIPAIGTLPMIALALALLMLGFAVRRRDV